MKILLSDSFDSSLPGKLSKFGQVTEDKDLVSEADVILVRSKTKCTKEYIDEAKKVKLIIRGGVGIDNIDKEYAESKNIHVCNTPKASAVAVAELAFSMMIAVPNHLIEAHESMKNGKFLKKELKRTELFGKTLCLVGLGNIACEIAERAKAFGMNVVAYRQSCQPSCHADVKKTLEEAVSEADYISLNTPLTESTEGMINSELISKMKDGVVIINTGRGKCVDASAVAEALNNGKIGTYATDVWPSDPPPGDYPILKAPNTLMVPHLGANSKENLLRIGDEVISIIEKYQKDGIL